MWLYWPSVEYYENEIASQPTHIMKIFKAEAHEDLTTGLLMESYSNTSPSVNNNERCLPWVMDWESWVERISDTVSRVVLVDLQKLYLMNLYVVQELVWDNTSVEYFCCRISWLGKRNIDCNTFSVFDKTSQRRILITHDLAYSLSTRPTHF